MQIIIILYDKPYFYFIHMICILLVVDSKFKKHNFRKEYIIEIVPFFYSLNFFK